MRPPQRPTALTVLAILNFVLGGLGILCSLGNAASAVLSKAVFKAMPMAPGGPNPGQMMEDMFDAIPGYIAFLVYDHAGTCLLGVLLIIAGVGLLKARPWGRMLSLAWAVLKAIHVVTVAAYVVVIVTPAMEKFFSNFGAQMAGQPGGGAMPPGMSRMQATAGAIGAIVTALFALAYPVALLIVLNTSSVRDAFVSPRRRDLDDDEGSVRPSRRGLDDDDDDRGRPDDRIRRRDDR